MNTEKNLVSIMIPTYNRPLMFEQALISALSQDYPHVEVLVADNSTDDRTEKVVQKYRDNPRLKYRRNRTAKTKADNFACFEEWARGEYLQWLMDDDILATQKLSRMIKVFDEHPEVTLVTSKRGIVDKELNLFGKYSAGMKIKGEYGILRGKEAGRALLVGCSNFIGEPSAVLFRRRDLKNHYWRAETRGFKVISDVVMWLELLEKGDLAVFEDSLSFFRVHEGQEGRQTDVIMLGFTEWEKIIGEYRRRNVFVHDDHECLDALVNFHKFLCRYFLTPEKVASVRVEVRRKYEAVAEKIEIMRQTGKINWGE